MKIQTYLHFSLIPAFDSLTPYHNMLPAAL